MAEKLIGTSHYWADQFGVGDKEIRKALDGAEQDGSRGSQPQYYLATVYRALLEREDIDSGHERGRKDKEAADKLALENARTRGDLGRLSEMLEWFGGHVDRCRARLIQIPDALGQFCDSSIAPAIIASSRRLIYEALAELAADSPETGSGSPGAVVAAANPDRQPVVGPGAPAI